MRWARCELVEKWYVALPLAVFRLGARPVVAPRGGHSHRDTSYRVRDHSSLIDAEGIGDGSNGWR